MARASVEPFYGAAARSMSQSWHDFVFGAFDPAGTITVDKLPGALWLQALSLRILGFHIWALVLPQVVEGVLTVLVLYRAVRRLAGTGAGLAAAVVLAVTPVTVLLGRGNVSDSLLILLLVLAADATSAALLSGRLRSLVLAGAWVGLAFQAKMVQAWLVLPALAAAYLLAAPAQRWRTRAGHVAVAGVVTTLVSLSWMSAVSLVPAHDRPYVDGSRNDSVYEQVFDYNGLARLGGPALASAGPAAPFLVTLVRDRQSSITLYDRPSWHRLLSGPFGRDGGWLLPAALAGAIAVLSKRRNRGRRDPLRAAVVMWGGWWATLAVFFSAGNPVNSYYIAALSPAVAALCGAGVAMLGPPPWPARIRLTMLAVVTVCCGYGLYLLHGAAVVPAWIWPAALAFAAAAAVLLVRRPGPGPAGRSMLAPALACMSVLVLPASAAASTVVRGLGPFDAPFESQQVSAVTQAAATGAAAVTRYVRQLRRIEPAIRRALFVTETSALAAPYILYSGHEVLPIGGFGGGAPAPTLTALQSDIRHGYVRLFWIAFAPPNPDPRLRWVRAHCTLDKKFGTPVQYAYYSCYPADVGPG
jgi:4-amino-4-deoxy-L-arabinose transferase-like glycosyltransferase